MDYVKNMTWSEFRLRLFAYRRLEKKLDYRQRAIQYQIYCSNFVGKKGQKPVSIDKYWQIDKKNIGVSEKAIERLREAQEEYRRNKNG